MQENTLVFELILNIALLVLIANLISKFRLIQNLILQERRTFTSQAFLAVVFGGIIGGNREHKRRPAGFRTYMMVSMGAALAMVLGQYQYAMLSTVWAEAQREVVYLRAFGGLSFREIGDVVGKTETWARVTFYRSKEKLKNGGASDEE